MLDFLLQMIDLVMPRSFLGLEGIRGAHYDIGLGAATLFMPRDSLRIKGVTGADVIIHRLLLTGATAKGLVNCLGSDALVRRGGIPHMNCRGTRAAILEEAR